MRLENGSIFSDVEYGTISEQMFSDLCERFSLSYKMTHGKAEEIISIKINPEDIEHPLIYIGQLGVTGNIYLRKTLIEQNQNPVKARSRKFYELVVHFDSTETGPIDMALATFSPRSILGLVVNTNLTTFNSFIRGTNEEPIKIIKEKMSMQHKVDDWRITRGLLQRTTRFQFKT